MTYFINILIIFYILSPKFSVPGMQPVGSEVVNQASISFEDETGMPHNITTNIVVLTIRQVYSATLDGDRHLDGVSGQSRAFIHTLHNTGNGPDTYCVSIENMDSDTGDFSKIQLIRDLNNNGRVDSSDPTIASTAKTYSTTVFLIADETAHLIILADIPESSSQGALYRLLLTVKARNGTNVCQDNSVTDLGTNSDNANDTNIDQLNITDQAILAVNKESVYQTNGEGISDDTISYAITIKNIGNRIARDVIITDNLPDHTLYQENSIQTASDFVSTPGIDDGANGSDGQVPFYDSRQIRGEIDTLPVDGEIVFTYILEIDSAAPGDTPIENTVSAQGDLDENETTDEAAVTSNKTMHTIPKTFGVEITDTGINEALNVNDGGDDDSSLNDQQYVDQASQGDTIWFTHQVINKGNADDTFSLIISNSNFPENTGFQFYHANHNSPLLDTNSDGNIDTGPVSPDEARMIVIGAVLPKHVSDTGPFSAVITARSNGNNTFEDTTQMRLGSINAHRVDIANTESAPGMHDIPNADPVSQITTIAEYDSKNGVTFDLYVANEGALMDQYQLSVWQDASAENQLPDSWNCHFYNLSGETITATPSIAPGQTFHCQLHVLLPDNQVPNQISIYIKVLSSVTLVWDIKQDAIKISQTLAIRMTPDNESTVAPGGAIEYHHNVQNIGNTRVDVQIAVLSQTLMSHSLLLPQLFDGASVASFKTLQNFTVGESIVIYDSSEKQWRLVELLSNGNGGISVPLDPDDYVQFKVRVMAPSKLSANSIDVLILEASVPGQSVRALNTDRTSISASQLQITKMGARDFSCDSDMKGLNQFGSSHFQASPGECIVWQIVAVNTGVEPVCEVKIYDKAPAFTFIQGMPIIYAQPFPGDSGSCSVNNEELECCVGNSLDMNGDGVLDAFCLRSGERAEIRFRVEIE